MNEEFVNLTPENLAEEHLCCIIRSKKPHPGVEAKREWLAERLPEGHVFRKLRVKGCAFIEYAPLEKAWVPITGENYLYLYCLWVDGPLKGHGYATSLLEYCLADARAQGRSGVCMLGAEKQKAWLSNQAFAKKFGFETVDTTENGYELLACSFDGTAPSFTPEAKRMEIDRKELTIYYDRQCPFIFQRIEAIRDYCAENRIPASLLEVTSPAQAKALPCVFNNWAVFWQGKFVTVNLSEVSFVEILMKK